MIYWDSRGGPLQILQITLTGFIYHCYRAWTLVGGHRLVDHMIVVGASSLRRTLDYLPYDLRVKYRRFTFAKSGLSLNPNNVSKLKKLQWLLRNGSLKSREIILWHDVTNNSITKHPKNFNTKCSPEQLTEIITNFQHQIAAIIYIRRDGTPHIFEKLRKTKPLIIDAIKRLLPKQKQNDIDTVAALSKLHPPPSLELKLLNKVFSKRHNLRSLVLQQRSKSRVRPTKSKRAAAKKKQAAQSSSH